MHSAGPDRREGSSHWARFAQQFSDQLSSPYPLGQNRRRERLTLSLSNPSEVSDAPGLQKVRLARNLFILEQAIPREPEADRGTVALSFSGARLSPCKFPIQIIKVAAPF